MEETEGRKFRWRYFIDKKFQNQFMLRFSLIIILVILVTLGLLWLLSENPYNTRLLPGGLVFSVEIDKKLQPAGNNNQQLPVSKLKPHNAFELFWKPIVFVGGLNLLLIIVFSLFYSHSIAGPIYNMKKVLTELVGGSDPRPIRIRKGDQFQDLVDLINQLIEKRVK